MRSILTAVVFVLFAAGVPAQDNKKFESKEGKYSVGFPGKPAMTSNKVGDIVLNVAAVEKGMGGFMVIYSDLPPDAVKVAKPKDLLEGGQKGLIDNFKAKVTSSKEFDFGKQKLPAREILAEKETIHLRIQIILAEARLYQVFIVGPKDMVTGKDADEFFKSFEIAK
jgi:hypothetical protein